MVQHNNFYVMENVYIQMFVLQKLPKCIVSVISMSLKFSKINYNFLFKCNWRIDMILLIIMSPSTNDILRQVLG